MKPLVEAICLMKGINMVAAATVLSVTGDLRRFASPMQLSSYFGLVPSEHSSGNKVKRTGITKAGNSEAAAHSDPGRLVLSVPGPRYQA